MTGKGKMFFNNFFLVTGYAAIFFMVQYALFYMGFLNFPPNNETLIAWDAAWYESISKKGYIYWEAANNTGFYFFFPLVWRLSHLDALGISLLNTLFFAAGFAWFSQLYKFSVTERIIFLSIPSIFYMLVPYAESLFFLFSVACLYGIVHQKRWLIWLSLFLLAITRANAAIFFPVLLFAELLSNNRKEWLKSVSKAFVLYGLPLIIGLAVFVLYQYYETGIWFVYFKVQTAYWGRKFAMPVFPLGSSLGPKVLWLNALALFTGFVSLLVLLKEGVNWLLKNEVAKDKLLLIAKLYLVAVMFLILFFNPTWEINRTNVFGAHRYMFASPFIMIFLYHFTGKKYQVRDFIMIALLCNIFWLLFASYEHIRPLLYFNFNIFLVFLFMLSANGKLSWPPVAIIAINFLLQVIIFQQFIGKIFTD